VIEHPDGTVQITIIEGDIQYVIKADIVVEVLVKM